ncbi:hypothetical protein V866_005404 [Kwoniella sp. B9012]
MAPRKGAQQDWSWIHTVAAPDQITRQHRRRAAGLHDLTPCPFNFSLDTPTKVDTKDNEDEDERAEVRNIASNVLVRLQSQEQDRGSRDGERERKLWDDSDAAIKEVERREAELAAATMAAVQRQKAEEEARRAQAEKLALAHKAEEDRKAKEQVEKERQVNIAKEQEERRQQERRQLAEKELEEVQAKKALSESQTTYLPSYPTGPPASPAILNDDIAKPYAYLLSHLSKALIKQAESEVNAKADAAAFFVPLPAEVEHVFNTSRHPMYQSRSMSKYIKRIFTLQLGEAKMRQ